MQSLKGMLSRMTVKNPPKYPEPPPANANSFIEYFSGRKVPDPYRVLEDADDASTAAYVDAQNAVTNDYLGQFSERAKLRSNVEKLFSFEKFSAPNRKGDGRWYWSYNPGLLNQAQIIRSTSDDYTSSQCEVFFDPNKLSDDGTVSLSASAFSKSGKLWAFSTSESGSDQQTIQVIKTDDVGLKPESDLIKYVKFSSISWLHDDSGFFYGRFPPGDTSGRGTTADEKYMLCFHRLGDSQDDDIVIMQNEAEPTNMFSAEVTDDGRYGLISETRDCDPNCKLYLVDLEDFTGKTAPQMTTLVNDFSAGYSYVANYGSRFIFKTNKDAPRWKLVQVDINQMENGFTDLISEAESPLEDATCVRNDILVLNYSHDVKSELSLWSADGYFLESLDLPIGTMWVSASHDSPVFYVGCTSFVSATEYYKYSFAEGRSTGSLAPFRKTKVDGFDSDEFVSEQVFYESKDGTKVPMFINRHKSVGKNPPTLLYAYGGFQISIMPYYSVFWAAWMKYFGGVVAVANIRGGSEYGEEWHKAAVKMKRQNAFDDFQYAARYLHTNGYTTPRRTAINGGSNGGLLCGVCLNQAPELYGAVLADVGVMDMLKFQKFTIGYAWTSDFGNPEESEEMFDYIRAYSPVNNVDPTKLYPTTMLTTADHDDRVVPAHSLKFIAMLQKTKPNNDNPLLIRVEKKAGHGAGKPTSLKLEEMTDKLAFLSLALAADPEGM